MTTAVANLKDTWATINKSTSSSASAVIYMYLDRPLEEIFTNSTDQENFADFYSETKKKLLADTNQDYNFCIFENQVFKGTDSQGKTFYYPPTNFIRFRRTDWRLINLQKQIRKNFWNTIAEHTFQYIGYIKDTNTDVEIPNEFYTLLGCELLLTHPILRKSTMDNAGMISEQLLTTRHSLISLKL